MPTFQPTEDQRRWVRAMAGFKMTWDEMCLLVINPRTGKPISKETFGKAFAAELANGKARLKQLIATKYLERLNAGDAWAIQFGFRHIFGWQENENDVTVAVNGPDANDKSGPMLQVSFVTPKANGHAEDD
jgi:hypothetical protein